MPVTRREFIEWGTAGLAGATLGLGRPTAVQAAGAARFKVGITDWNLQLEGKVEAVALAKRIGFDGVQVSIGKGEDRLPLSDLGSRRCELCGCRVHGLLPKLPLPRPTRG